jgi:hypothetical protein
MLQQPVHIADLQNVQRALPKYPLIFLIGHNAAVLLMAPIKAQVSSKFTLWISGHGDYLKLFGVLVIFVNMP